MPREVGTGFQPPAPLPCQLCACGFIPVMNWAAGAVRELPGHHHGQRAELGLLTSQGPCQPALHVQPRWLCGIWLCSEFRVLSV